MGFRAWEGNGAVTPQLRSHGNGLLALPRAIYEFIMEKILNKVFLREKATHKTVGYVMDMTERRNRIVTR